MKKILVVALTLVLMFAMAVPAMAAGGPGGGRGSGGGTMPAANPPAAAAGNPSGNAAGTGSGQGSGTAGGNGNAARFGEEKGNESGVFSMVGSIAGLDPVAYTVSVAVVGGNKLARPVIGQTVTIQAAVDTRFLLNGQANTGTYGDPNTQIAFEDLEVGQNVSVNGELDEGVWLADRFTVAPLLSQYSYNYNYDYSYDYSSNP